MKKISQNVIKEAQHIVQQGITTQTATKKEQETVRTALYSDLIAVLGDIWKEILQPEDAAQSQMYQQAFTTKLAHLIPTPKYAENLQFYIKNYCFEQFSRAIHHIVEAPKPSASVVRLERLVATRMNIPQEDTVQGLFASGAHTAIDTPWVIWEALPDLWQQQHTHPATAEDLFASIQQTKRMIGELAGKHSVEFSLIRQRMSETRDIFELQTINGKQEICIKREVLPTEEEIETAKKAYGIKGPRIGCPMLHAPGIYQPTMYPELFDWMASIAKEHWLKRCYPPH